jgi:hypothetical protein
MSIPASFLIGAALLSSLGFKAAAVAFIRCSRSLRIERKSFLAADDVEDEVCARDALLYVLFILDVLFTGDLSARVETGAKRGDPSAVSLEDSGVIAALSFSCFDLMLSVLPGAAGDCETAGVVLELSFDLPCPLLSNSLRRRKERKYLFQV